jgi:hypothetical protein
MTELYADDGLARLLEHTDPGVWEERKLTIHMTILVGVFEQSSFGINRNT